MLRPVASRCRALIVRGNGVSPNSLGCRYGSWLSMFKAKTPVALPPTASKDHTSTEIKQHKPKNTEYRTWDYDVEFFALCHRLHFPLEKSPLLLQALTHSSFVDVLAGQLQQDRQDLKKLKAEADNERLACFGKSATHCFINEHLFLTFPTMPVECINALTGYLTQLDALALTVQHLGMIDLIRCSNQHPISQLDVLPLSQVFYATVGALYCCEGIISARKFVHDYVLAHLQEQDLFDLIQLDNPKILLRQLLRHQHKPAPLSRLLHSTGAASHQAVFWAAIYCGRTQIGKGFGMSLNKAEAEACRDALRRYFLSELFNAPMPYKLEQHLPKGDIRLLGEQGEVKVLNAAL